MGWQSEDARWHIAATQLIETFSSYSSEHRLQEIAPPTGAPIGYPPLFLFLSYPLVLAARLVGLADSWFLSRYTWLLYGVDIASIYITVSTIRRLRPDLSPLYLKIITLLLFFSGYFLYASGYIGHPDTLVLLFLLLGVNFVQKSKFFSSGIFFGLALATKQLTIFAIIPTFFYLYFQKEKRSTLYWSLSLLFIFILAASPFLINNFSDFWYGLVGFTSLLKIEGPNFWWFMNALISRLPGGLSFTNLFVHTANIAVLLLSVLVSCMFAYHLRREKKTHLYGLFAVNFFIFTIFGKWTSWHYFLYHFVFLLLWDIEASKGQTFPIVWVVYSLVILSLQFVGTPLWQIALFMTQFFLFLYLLLKLTNTKIPQIRFEVIFTMGALTYLFLGVWSFSLNWVSGDARWHIGATAALSSFSSYTKYRVINPAATPPRPTPLVYTPLSFYLAYPFVIAGGLLGVDMIKGNPIYPLLFLYIDILNIYLITLFIRRFRPHISKVLLIGITIVCFFSGLFLYTSAHIGHPDTLVILFSLLSLYLLITQKSIKFVLNHPSLIRLWWSGVLMGLALSSKQSALFIVIPIFFFLLINIFKPKPILVFTGGIISATLVIVLPFFIVHFTDAWFGMIGFTHAFIIHGPNMWWFFNAILTKIFHIQSVTYYFRLVSPYVLMGTVLASSIILIRKGYICNVSKLLGLICLNLLLFSILGSLTQLHYFLVNFVFILLWEMSLKRGAEFPVVWVTYTFLVAAVNYIQMPVWQPATLLINCIFALYIAKNSFIISG